MLNNLDIGLGSGNVVGRVGGGSASDTPSNLLLHMDGADESTTFTDSGTATSAHTLTANGTAQVDTAQKVFGTGSLINAGADTDFISTPYSADWDFGTGDFTIDWRMRFNALGVFNEPFVFNAYDPGWLYQYTHNNGGSYQHEFYINGNLFTVTKTLAINTWYHIAVVRKAGVLYVFQDGTLEDSGAFAFDVAVGSGDLKIGYGNLAGNGFNGWIDEFRVIKGSAEWTETFTPPTEAYNA